VGPLNFTENSGSDTNALFTNAGPLHISVTCFILFATQVSVNTELNQ